MEGGITFSGGEPLLQAEFVAQSADLLKKKGFHLALETCGQAPRETFQKICRKMDRIIMDLKLMDPEMHRQYTGVDNLLIRKNAQWLKESGLSHQFRTPLIPNITDTKENLSAIHGFVGESPWEQLPYNTLAGAKYPLLGMEYQLTKGTKS